LTPYSDIRIQVSTVSNARESTNLLQLALSIHHMLPHSLSKRRVLLSFLRGILVSQGV
jgi:hypothetical protein